MSSILESVLPFESRPQVTVSQWAVFGIGAVTLYVSLRCIYLLHFHPAAKFPGPRIAAISNVWYAYHWVTGKYPMSIAKVLDKYGDIVRIAPNELVFITPQAASDIYASHTRYLEHFPRTDFLTITRDDGLSWERDPGKHRRIAKRVSPAFSAKAIRAKEPTIHKYIDDFVQKMADVGGRDEGIELRTWADWVAMDISAELAYGRQMDQLQDMRSSSALVAVWGANFFATVNQIFKKFPLLSPIKFLFVPPAVIASLPRVIKINRQEVNLRIERRHDMMHLDHFEQLLARDAPSPNEKEKQHIGVIAGQLLLAGYEPIASQFLCTIMFLLQEPEILRLLVKEIREKFNKYEDITPATLASLQFLHACLMETLRLTVIGGGGLPRVSPGAVVDGNYVPGGVTVQYGHYAFTRSRRYFHHPYSYRPQRWLPENHPHWEPAFKDDARDSFFPFSQGPRACPGMGLAWRETRLFVAKVLWSFDAEVSPQQRGVVFERDFKLFGMWEKPKFWVRLHLVAREKKMN